MNDVMKYDFAIGDGLEESFKFFKIIDSSNILKFSNGLEVNGTF